MTRIIETEDQPDPKILDRRREIQAEIATLTTRHDVPKADREELRRTRRTDDAVLDEATALIQQMEMDDLTARFEIRQRLRTRLRRIVEVTHFTGHRVGFARVQIRGGVVLVIPLDKASQERAGYRKTWAWQRAVPNAGISPLEPNEVGPQLIAAE
ncbi:hypothetical protein [Methylobacterium sp. SyP6R]|uniref:hypothetical protein n=1 Tax=Methylobacterium sp. SyP6R TaxID=2718876 RepID=UPI001F451750|nr:hypothetical protein [Methylobacterium sp. SyP6R]MCF4127560.1 hypothetical protein [Methylobacterium sp. SyP6R]